MAKKKIKFLEDATYKQSGPDGKTDPKLTRVFKKGSTHELENDDQFADRWIRRGLAVEVDHEEPKSTEVSAPKKPEPKKPE